MFKQMFDFYDRVVRDGGEFGMQSLDDARSVSRAIEEIGIAKGNMLCARRDLLADIGKDHVPLDHTELPAVDRYDRTVPAQMLAASRRLRVGDLLELARLVEMRVVGSQIAAIGRQKFKAIQRDLAHGLTARELHQRRFEFSPRDGVD